MKKNKKRDEFLEQLRKVPIVLIACQKSGLSRNSIYRWRKEDEAFAASMDEALQDGETYINEMSEAQMLNKIKEGDWSVTRYWLSHRHPKFKEKVEISGSLKTVQELSPDQEELVRNALKLADITLGKHE